MLFKHGFSLLELLIVLVIIGILTCMAYPVYTAHIIKTRRAYAAVALIDLAGKLEQYYIVHNTYENATLTNLNTPDEVVGSFYRLAIIQLTTNSYLISATPQQAQIKDVQCGDLILNQLGEKSISGSGSSSDCW